MADSMLRAALNENASAAARTSAAPSISTAPPSYCRIRPSNTEAMLGVSPLSSVSNFVSTRSNREKTPETSPETMRSSSDPMAEKIAKEHLRIAQLHRTDPFSASSKSRARHLDVGDRKHQARDAGINPLERITAAESKSRIRRMEVSMKQASAQKPPRATAGLFKEACSTDILFLIDATGSMHDYIDAAKNQVKAIYRDVMNTFLNEAPVRVAVVTYKDHGSKDQNIQFLDFVSSPDKVSAFLDGVAVGSGEDIPEDVLGGLHQAINASWKLSSRCLIHIADAPPHGGILHDFPRSWDSYYEHGSEPHRFTYIPLLRRLVQLNINYALLRINNSTDRTVLMFSQVYKDAFADVKLLQTNKYFDKMNSSRQNLVGSAWSGLSSKRNNELQFEEMPLGTDYNLLKHLVVKAATSSASRTASRLMNASIHSEIQKASPRMPLKMNQPPRYMPTIRSGSNVLPSSTGSLLEDKPPQWNNPAWLDETLFVEGYCPAIVAHGASTLNDMLALDENIKLDTVQLKIRKRSRPFAQGSVRNAYYAHTDASTNRFVVKSGIHTTMELQDTIEDMRIQALCKAFALEFNSLLKTSDPVDFIVTTGLTIKYGTCSMDGSISLEPFIDGTYVKYNSNQGWVNETKAPLNLVLQAFSHFTFERSWGKILVSDLQGVGHNLTDPSIQTKEEDRFKLTSTNFNIDGMKFFFATHECNGYCKELGLKSAVRMFETGDWEFREEWPTIKHTVYCSNKFCGKIILLKNAQKSHKYPGCHWCDACWPQLQATMVQTLCEQPGEEHSFDLSLFYFESQGQVPPERCSEHLEKDTTAFTAASAGGSLWNRMKAKNDKTAILGNAW